MPAWPKMPGTGQLAVYGCGMDGWMGRVRARDPAPAGRAAGRGRGRHGLISPLSPSATNFPYRKFLDFRTQKSEGRNNKYRFLALDPVLLATPGALPVL